jgi:hypothetical protein
MTRVACVIMLAFACACSVEGRLLPEWTRGPSASDKPFALRHELVLGDAERGRTLTLHVDCFHAPLALHVDGVELPDYGVLRLGTHRFVIPDHLTRSGRLSLELRGRGERFGAPPRIELGVASEPNAIGSFNYTIGVIALASMILLTFLFVTIYALDRKREYAAAIVATATAVWIGFAGLLPGRVGTAAIHFGLAINFAALLIFAAAYFGVQTSRVWHVWVRMFAVASLACVVVAPLVNVVLTLGMLTRIGFFIYIVALYARLSLRSSSRGDARIMLVGYIGVLGFSAADIVPGLFGVPSGVHAGPLATIAISIATGVAVLRRHARHFSSLEVTTADLRRQVAARSRELAEALATLPAARPIARERLVDGRYRILRHLGAGGMGSVHEAERIADGERVAVKVLHGTADATAAARLAREAHVAAALVHPNLVPVIDVGLDSGSVFLVMPLIGGGSLDRQLPLSEPARVKALLADVAAGLATLHEHGIVHRDLKPANILLDGERARLSDFGLVSLQRSEPLAQSTLAPGEVPLTGLDGVPGTPRYMAPELRNGAGQATQATDVYAFGVISRDLANGFSRPPDWLVSVADRCTHPDATQRPTAEAVVAELRDDSATRI